MIDSNPLTTVAMLKAWLGITVVTDDTILGYAVDRASKIVQAYCGRNFTSQRYFEIRDGAGENRRIALMQTPVQSIRFVGVGWDSVMSINSTVLTDVFCAISVLETSVLLHRVTVAGVEATTTATFAAYPTTALLATYISTVTGFKAEVSTNVDTRYLRKMGGRNLRQTTAYLEAPVDAFDDYQVDLDAGIVYGNTLSSYRSILIDYTAGYATIPADIEQAATSVAARLYQGRARDAALSSESLGGYSYSVRAAAEVDSLEREMLAPYRRIR